MKRFFSIVVLLLVLVLAAVSPVFAAITNPDSGPYILQVDAYQNLDTSGDVLILARIRIPYATPPSEPVSDTFIGRILLAGVEIQATTLYAYPTTGYNYTTFAIYATSDITWSGSYTVNLAGSPTVEWSGDVPGVSTTTINWHTSASTSLSRSLLATNILSWASALSGYWSGDLLTTTAGGSVLNEYGVQYFSNVIPYLSSLCPAVFPMSQTPATYDDQDFQDAGSIAVTSQWPFDFSGISDWMGLPDENLLHILIAAALVGFMCVSLKLDSKMSILAGFTLILILAIPGFLSPIVAASTIFVAVLGMGLVFILGKTA